MAFTYHPPTRTTCPVCDELKKIDIEPIIDTQSGRASSANNFPFHNWYNFVLGYTPKFPEFMLERENITHQDFVVDPFMGSGTTLVACKYLGIPSSGVDANDFMAFAASVKLDWTRDIEGIIKNKNKLLEKVEQEFSKVDWTAEQDYSHSQMSIFDNSIHLIDFKEYADKYRPEMLSERYMSDKPFVKAHIIKEAIKDTIDSEYTDLFKMSLSSILVPISNVSYGPGFGVKKAKDDVDVYSVFSEKINRMINDLQSLNQEQKNTPSTVHLGDARKISDYYEPNSVKLMITSPPYPGDHEYTKHTRLELIFDELASDIQEFRTIKKRMIRGSTTNIYKDDNDRETVEDLQSIREVTDLIQERLDHDGATSGFEKLYTKLVWEYFGGMFKALEECYKVLEPGGKIALLVSDSHAFKMVHIQTAKILEEIGLKIGYSSSEILLWQHKKSTSHKYDLREDILILQK
ncbi:DNA methyltransferase [Thalassobacillus devorans]|uniref:DNA methyltransferase n=1 Tax=Thalassobacillus devorans TaxID=279813 RepID=UPI00048C160D|nr:DNA methyltransferase [Thalassobacillus devorans]